MPLYNDIGASEVIFEAVKLARGDYKFKNNLNNLSVTSLINPPKVTELNRRHRDEIQEPLSKNIRSWIGTCVHSGVERVQMDGLISEKRLEFEFDGVTVSGMFDILVLKDDYVLEDIKCTSLWNFIYKKDGKDEWKNQLNLYAWLIEKCMGIRVSALQVNAILYDWTPALVKRMPNAPKAPEVSVKLRLWDNIEVEMYLKKRIALYKDCQKLPDDQIPCCSKEERWHQPKKYLAIKRGNKTPSKTFYSYTELRKYLYVWKKKGVEFDIDVVEATDSRCVQYCPANVFCNYYKDTYMKDAEKIE